MDVLFGEVYEDIKGINTILDNLGKSHFPNPICSLKKSHFDMLNTNKFSNLLDIMCRLSLVNVRF